MLYNCAATPDGQPANARRALDEPAFTQLAQVRAACDPASRFRFNINVKSPNGLQADWRGIGEPCATVRAVS